MNLLWRIAYRAAYAVLLAYWFLFRPSERGVYVAMWCGDRVLLLRNSYRRRWAMPCGGVARGESDRAAAVRETAEEVGVAIDPGDLRLVGGFLSREQWKRDESVVFEIEVPREPAVVCDGREVVRAEFVASAEARSRDLVSIARQYLEWKLGGVDHRISGPGIPDPALERGAQGAAAPESKSPG